MRCRIENVGRRIAAIVLVLACGLSGSVVMGVENGPALLPAAPSPSGEGGSPQPAPRMSAWKVAAVFGAAEGMMAVFAAVARKNPREVGWTWVGVSPLIALIPAEGSESTRAGMIAAGVGAAALGIYHIETLSDETISDRDRFWKSFTAHHLAFVAPVVIEALAHRRGRKGKGQSFPEIRPFVDGDSVGMNLRWVH